MGRDSVTVTVAEPETVGSATEVTVTVVVLSLCMEKLMVQWAGRYAKKGGRRA